MSRSESENVLTNKSIKPSEASNRPTTETEKEKDKQTEKDVDKEEDEEDRAGFGNGFEFVLTCLGLAVGLGNIWRFPTRAYANGGSAFLIPYLACATLFGLPAVYLEFVAGQYQRASPPIVFRRMMPIAEGIGWAAAMVSALTAVYYIVLISWICIYIINLFRHMDVWNNCNNRWNTEKDCLVLLDQPKCLEAKYWPMNTTIPDRYVFKDGICHNGTDFDGREFVSGTEQYFRNHILDPSTGLMDISGINWPVFGGMTFCWFLTGLLILKGPKIMGKVSYVTVILPYLLVTALAIRGLFLEGSTTGLYYYFGNPDYSKLLDHKTWTEALKQLCFSLSIGHGGLMSLASYSKKHNNCFRDALIVIIGDTLMSIIGGTAVFSVLGFLAHKRGVTVPEVVQSGLSLAFVVYPEAISQIPGPTFFMFLFFVMLFLLAISSEIALTEVICSCIYDQFPSLKKRKTLVVMAWCFLLYCIGFVFSTNAGFYWFELYDEYAAGFSSVFVATFEFITFMWLYGGRRFCEDARITVGEPNSKVTAMIGPHSPYFVFNWRFIAPSIGAVLVALSFLREYPYTGDGFKYPPLFDIFGWLVSFTPVFMIPLFAILNYFRFKREGYETSALFQVQKQHASFKRIYETYSDEKKASADLLPDKEPWAEETKPCVELGTKSEQDTSKLTSPSANEYNL